MSAFKKFSLKAKLFCAFSVVSFFVLLVGGASFISGRMTVAEYRKIALKNLPASVAAANLRGLSKDVRSTLLRMGISGVTDEELDSISSRLKDLLTQFDDAAREYQALPFVEGEQVLFESSHQKWKALEAAVNKTIEVRMKKTPEAIQEYNSLLKGEFKDSNSAFSDAINDLVVFQQEQATKSRENAEHAEAVGTRTSLALIIFGFLIAMGVGYLFGRNLAGVLIGLSNRLRSGTENVDLTAVSIGSMSEELAALTQEQAAAIQETSSAVTEISSTVEKSTEGAKQSETFAQCSQTDVRSGKAAIDSLVLGLEGLKAGNEQLFQRVSETSGRMDKLVGIIKEIESKTKVIDDIVFQTKLLSFNASVEAARAGEAGKGFAVVAEEVGNLAQMSGRASREIASMLLASVENVTQIASESKVSLQATIDDTNRSLTSLNEKVCASKEIFDRIDSSSNEVVKQMGQICQATLEQNTGMREISKAVLQLDTATQKNATISEKAASSAAGLKADVGSLKFVISDLLETVWGGGNSQVTSAPAKVAKVAEVKAFPEMKEPSESSKVA